MSDTQFMLGKLIDGSPSRDAVHIAVAPVIASGELQPGQHVGFVTSSQEVVGVLGVPIGIVDPFLKQNVQSGERFWLYLYPNTITSLHHLWTHPAFGQEAAVFVPAGATSSEKWIREYADEIGVTYSDLMDGADSYVRSRERGGYGEYISYGDLLEGVATHDDFWGHYENVRGKKIPDDHRGSFFSCSC